LLTGCGSGKADARKRAACLLDAENAAATTVVARLYERGELGSPAVVRARYFADVDRSAYLDAHGGLKPWSELHGEAEQDLGRWIFEKLRLSSRFGDRIEAAYARGRQAAHC